MGKALQESALQDGYRRQAFLMTKIEGRTGPETRKQIDESLRHLKTDTVDLLQIHEVIRMGNA
jgi:diketogulonate reductase-like aldo/keto reductase